MIPVEVPRWRVTVPPAVEPVPLADLKSHLRVVGTTDDGYIGELARAARSHIERIQGRAHITQTRTLTLDAFPDQRYIECPGGPLQSITSIVYTTENGTPTTLSSAAYRVDTATEPGLVILKVDEEWPADTLIETSAIVVTYVAGHAISQSTVTITQATPAVVTWASHGLSNGASVSLSTTGALLTGLTAERTYYVAQAAAGTFQLSATPGGSSIATTGSQSGTHTATSVWRVPSSIIHAIKLLVAYWYEQREAAGDVRIEEAPMALQTLIDADRLWGFA